MAGIAATLHADSSVLDAISTALEPRGPSVAVRHVGTASLLVRSVLPELSGPGQVALAIDGVAEPGRLAREYAERGAVGLIGGAEPYAVILGDGDRRLLVLARNGDGPPLYWARGHTRRGPAVFAASEPGALLAAGVPAEPDPAAVARFIATGACDDGAATLLDGVHRVLPGQVIEVSLAEAVPAALPAWRADRVPAPVALDEAAAGRIGVRLDAGLADAALLGAALASLSRPRPLPVYSAAYPGLTIPDAGFAAGLLAELPLGATRHRAYPCLASLDDLDRFLREVGPVPDLTGYLLWCVARSMAGEVDTLLDATGARSLLDLPGPDAPGDSAWAGATGYLGRLSDRLTTRFGVTVRLPYLRVSEAGSALRGELGDAIHRYLPPAAARYALAVGGASAAAQALRGLLSGMAATVAETLLSGAYARRPWADPAGMLASLGAVAAGHRVDPAPVFRTYLVERWFSLLAPAATAPIVVPPRRPARIATPDPQPSTVAAAGERWTRLPIRTPLFEAGDDVALLAARHVGAALAGLVADPPRRAGLEHPWYVVVAAKAVAVGQGRTRPVWQIHPGRRARLVTWLAGGRHGLDTGWAAQVAIEDAGLARALAAAATARAGAERWYPRVAGDAITAIRGPRATAAPPARVAAVRAVDRPSEVAAALLAAVRAALPPEVANGPAGCAVIAASAGSVSVLGWAGGAAGGSGGDESGGATPDTTPPDLLVELCAGNPLGQADEHTPVALIVRAPGKTAQRAATPRASRPARQRGHGGAVSSVQR